MTRISKKILLFSVAFLTILFAGLQPACTKDQNEPERTVKVAFNIPLSGDFGIYGQMIRDGALFAKSDLDSEGSRTQFDFDFQDNAGKPSTAVSIMQRQLMKPVDIYVSGVKPQTMAIFDQVKARKIPHFVWIFDAFICAKNENTFRTWVSFKQEPEKYLKYIEYRKAKKIAVALVNVPHVEEEMKEILFPELRKRGFQDKDIFVEIFDWTEKDFKNSAAKMKTFNPDLIIISGFQPNVVGWIKALRAYDMVKDGNVIGTYDTLDAIPVLDKDQLEGIRLIAPLFSIEEKESSVPEWKERFKAKFGREPLYTDAYSYDMIKIIADAASRLTGHATSEAWVAALKATNTNGVTGPLVFDPDKDLKVTLRIGVIRDGKVLVDESDM
jgi:branched-chain amino acid transport system substrate-binding protein